MAVRKRRIKRLKPAALTLFIFIVSFVFYLSTAIFVRSYNVSISQKTQDHYSEITVYEKQNAALALEIQELRAYDRVMAIASEDDLALHQDNIITVRQGK